MVLFTRHYEMIDYAVDKQMQRFAGRMLGEHIRIKNPAEQVFYFLDLE